MSLQDLAHSTKVAVTVAVTSIGAGFSYLWAYAPSAETFSQVSGGFLALVISVVKIRELMLSGREAELKQREVECDQRTIAVRESEERLASEYRDGRKMGHDLLQAPPTKLT